MDVSAQWGLPPGFQPVRYIISEEAKDAVRGVLKPQEPVIISIGNEADTIAIVATPHRVLSVKTSGLGAGVKGAMIREYPWDGIFDIVITPMTHNVKLAFHFRSSDGRTVETGRRASMAKEQVENLMAFEKVGGQDVFRALLQVWNYKKTQAD